MGSSPCETTSKVVCCCRCTRRVPREAMTSRSVIYGGCGGGVAGSVKAPPSRQSSSRQRLFISGTFAAVSLNVWFRLPDVLPGPHLKFPPSSCLSSLPPPTCAPPPASQADFVQRAGHFVVVEMSVYPSSPFHFFPSQSKTRKLRLHSRPPSKNLPCRIGSGFYWLRSRIFLLGVGP